MRSAAGGTFLRSSACVTPGLASVNPRRRPLPPPPGLPPDNKLGAGCTFGTRPDGRTALLSARSAWMRDAVACWFSRCKLRSCDRRFRRPPVEHRREESRTGQFSEGSCGWRYTRVVSCHVGRRIYYKAGARKAPCLMRRWDDTAPMPWSPRPSRLRARSTGPAQTRQTRWARGTSPTWSPRRWTWGNSHDSASSDGGLGGVGFPVPRGAAAPKL